MLKKQVAIIDIGSSKISAIVGEKGINNTFVIKLDLTYNYDGFAESSFFDKNSVVNILKKISAQFIDFFHGDLDKVYVGIPGAFTNVVAKDCQISFKKKKKITNEDVAFLFDSSNNSIDQTKYTVINRSSIFYELGDCRRLANPINATSEILKAKLSYIYCNNDFIDFIKQTLQGEGILNVEFISSPLAESLYLLEPDIRDRIAIVLDVGHISSTLFVVQGDGIIHIKSFDFGGGHITAALCNYYGLSFDDAEKIKRKVNLSSFSDSKENYEVLEGENNDYYNLNDVKHIILSCLDELCDKIYISLNELKINIPDFVGLMITGGGISYLRGANEHVAGRINRTVQVLKPNVPMRNKPTMSSILSLLSLALER